MRNLSVVIPAKNEAGAIASVVRGIRKLGVDIEIIVVDDGSEDDTADQAVSEGARVIRHPYSIGNGGSVKTGARAASGEHIVFMDGDGQHLPSEIPKLFKFYEEHGYDMAVGARRGISAQANLARSGANGIYNRLASIIVGHKVDDLTSGFRVVRAKKFREFIHLLPNGFSYPTTCTMAFFRAGYSVGYFEISTKKRQGKSHISLAKDGLRFFLIIFKIGTLYAPLKIFFPAAFVLFMLGTGYYGYTLLSFDRFTNMSLLLFVGSMIVFLIGLVSEQITMLLYKRDD